MDPQYGAQVGAFMGEKVAVINHIRKAPRVVLARGGGDFFLGWS